MPMGIFVVASADHAISAVCVSCPSSSSVRYTVGLDGAAGIAGENVLCTLGSASAVTSTGGGGGPVPAQSTWT